jgi:glycosyltransferase involved in cell wall biosynthesis
MRIGLLIYGSLETLSGGYLYDRKLVEYLRRQGDEVRVISLPWRNYAAHLGDNLRFRLPPGLDILIEDELNHPSLLAANRHRLGYPVVSLVHHLRCSEERPAWQNALYRLVERRYLGSIDGFIFNSQTTRGVVTGLMRNRKPGVVAYPPTDRFGGPLPEEVVRARAAESGPLRLLFLGSVIPRKGLETVLKALSPQRTRRNTKETPLFTLDVVGSLAADPAYARRMQALASGLGPSSPIRFHGALDETALAAQLRQAQVLVVPSSYEGFGIVYLEGMGFGLPAIGSTVGAAGEIIRPGGTGYLITPGDAQALAAHLHALATDRGLLAQFALNALARYKQQPPWEQTAGEIRGFLKKMRE